MSALLEPEQDTVLALKLMGMRKTASDTEFAAVLSELLGTCRHEGFRIAIKALEIILNEKNVEAVAKGVKEIQDKPKVVAPQLRELRGKSGDQRLQNDLPPQIHPMRTREEALAIHRKNHPELYNADGTRKGFEKQVVSDIPPEEDYEYLERATRPDPPPNKRYESHAEDKGYKFKGPTGKARKIDDAGREDIRRRAKQARLDGQGRFPKGFIKRLAGEFDVSEALIYQIIYSDPGYEAVPKP